MGLFRRTRSVAPELSSHELESRERARGPALVEEAGEIAIVESKLNGGADGPSEESDVFVCRRSSPDLTPLPIADDASTVTLFVFGWHHVEPGSLSWSFPSLRAALDAVRTMRNAAQWCIVSGESWASLDAARDGGAVLIEQLG